MKERYNIIEIENDALTEEEIKKSVNYQWAKIILNIFEKVVQNG